MLSSTWLKCFSSHPFASWLIWLGFCRIFVFICCYFTLVFFLTIALRKSMNCNLSLVFILCCLLLQKTFSFFHWTSVFILKRLIQKPFLGLFLIGWLRFIYSFLLLWIYYYIPIFWNMNHYHILLSVSRVSLYLFIVCFPEALSLMLSFLLIVKIWFPVEHCAHINPLSMPIS